MCQRSALRESAKSARARNLHIECGDRVRGHAADLEALRLSFCSTLMTIKATFPSTAPRIELLLNQALTAHTVCEVFTCASRLHVWRGLGGPHSDGEDPLPRLF